MRKIILIIALILICGRAEAAEEKIRVAVMVLGQFSGAITSDLRSEKFGAVAAEYLTEALADSEKFFVAAQEHIAEKIAAENLQTSGEIAPSMARKIAKVLNVDYIIFGTVNGVSGDTMTLEILSNGANIHTVRVVLIVQMMYAKTGRLIVARGEGTSKSSLVKAGTKSAGYITVGKKKISLNSVDNALDKAARAVVADLETQLDDFVADNN